MEKRKSRFGLPRRCAVLLPRRRARRRKGRAGELLVGLGQGGTAARPLNGGALTRWGARTPARGPATAPWLPAPLLRSLGALAAAERVRERRRGTNEG